jgi:SAM-dependent methyltransferase
MENNTARSFRDKWTHNERLAWDETLRESSEVQSWILNRNGFATLADLRAHLAGKRRVLDAGCGNGRVTQLLRLASDPSRTEVMGIDLVAADVAAENLKGQPNVRFAQKDLLGDLTDLGKFDFIYCQEVLHHTQDPKRSFLNLVARLENGGEIAIYVYRKKAPAREFVDDYIRDRIKDLPYEKAMKACEQITELGRTLSELKLKVNIPAVDVLEIPAGEYDVQRFLYHFFMKAFWNPELDFQANTAINYDWYHPQLCSRHTMAEVLGWYREAGLKVVHQFEDFYGITVRGAR